jgi:hypothetical protein
MHFLAKALSFLLVFLRWCGALEAWPMRLETLRLLHPGLLTGQIEPAS